MILKASNPASNLSKKGLICNVFVNFKNFYFLKKLKNAITKIQRSKLTKKAKI